MFGRILCSIGRHKWYSYRVAREGDDIQHFEDASPMKHCLRDDCQTAVGGFYSDEY